MTRKAKPLGRFTVVGALIAVIALCAASSASASTKVPVWSSGGTNLTYGSEVAFSGGSVSGLTLKWTWSGVPFWVQCNSLSANGTVENYASGKAGTMKPAAENALKFKGCVLIQAGEVQTIWNNTTCSVPAEMPAEIKSGELTNTPYTSGGLKLTNFSMSFYINNCPGGFLQNLLWTASGSFTGNEGKGAWPGEVLFPEGTSVTVNNGATKGEINFGLNVQGAGPTPIKIAEEEITEPSTPGHHYWYTGGGQRKGEGPLTLVTPGTPLTITGGFNSMTIEGRVAGVSTTVSCSGAGSTSGTVENPAGEKDGIANVSFATAGCAVTKPTGKSCVVKGGGFTTSSLPGTLSGTEWPLLQLKPAGEFANITLEKCTVAGMNNTFPLSGLFYVSPYMNLSNAGRWSIPTEANKSGSGLTWAGQQASIRGEVTAETAGGVAVTLK
jgi:hypothetical protein